MNHVSLVVSNCTVVAAGSDPEESSFKGQTRKGPVASSCLLLTEIKVSTDNFVEIA